MTFRTYYNVGDNKIFNTQVKIYEIQHKCADCLIRLIRHRQIFCDVQSNRLSLATTTYPLSFAPPLLADQMAICRTSSGAVDKMCLLITLARSLPSRYAGVKEMRKLNLPMPFKKSGGAGGKASKQQHRPESERGSEAPMMRSGRARE